MEKLKDLTENKTLCYFPGNDPKYLKVEKIFHIQKDYNGDEISKNVIGLRVYINLNAPIYSNRTEDYNLKLLIEKSEGDVCTKYYLHPNFFFTFLNSCFSDIIESLQTGDERSISKYLTSYDKIVSINNSSSKNHFTALTFLFPKIDTEDKANQIQEISKIIKNPDDDFLTTLTDFSKIPLDFSFISDDKKISYDEAKKKIDSIFEKSKLSKEMIDELKATFNINAYSDFQNKKSDFWETINPLNWNAAAKKLFQGKSAREIFLEGEKVTSGGILHGPPGTGKTYMVKNTVIKIYEEVFGYNVISIPMSDLSKGASYYGALLQAVTRIFQKGLEKVQSTRRPVLIFVDESDRIIKKSSREDDGDGFAAMKNFINPSIYPGIQLCLVTNIDKVGQMQDGIPGRRLRPVYVDYPDLDTTKKVWKSHIEEKVFGMIHKPIFKDSSGNIQDNDLVYEDLGKLVANKVGLDMIENFCKLYRDFTNTSTKDPITNISRFKIEFFKKSMQTIENFEHSALENFRHENRHLVNDNDIQEIKDNYQETRNRLIAAFSGVESETMKIEENMVLESLRKKDSNNILMKKFVSLRKNYYDYSDTYLKDGYSDSNKLSVIFNNSDFLERYFNSLISILKKNFSSNKQVIEILKMILENCKSFSSKELSIEGNDEILLKNPLLITSKNLVISSKDKENFFSITKHYFDQITEDIFEIQQTIEKQEQHTSQQNVQNLLNSITIDDQQLHDSKGQCLNYIRLQQQLFANNQFDEAIFKQNFQAFEKHLKVCLQRAQQTKFQDYAIFSGIINQLNKYSQHQVTISSPDFQRMLTILLNLIPRIQ